MHTRARRPARPPDPVQSRQEELRTMLGERQREMQHALQRRVDASATGHGDGLDESEHAEVEVQGHLEVALLQIKGETLRRVREALLRLDAGEYGRCDECDSEISAKRLSAMPFAVRCTDCETLHEEQAARERRRAAVLERL